MPQPLPSGRFMPREEASVPEWRALAGSVAAKLERIGRAADGCDGPDREARLLQVVDAAGRRGVSQAEIAAALRVSASCVTRLIDRLEKDGLISRRQHPTDRRINTVHVTPAGSVRVAEAQRRMAGAREAALACMSMTELSTLDALLGRIGGVQAFGGRPG